MKLLSLVIAVLAVLGVAYVMVLAPSQDLAFAAGHHQR